jgi:amino acid transporter
MNQFKDSATNNPKYEKLLGEEYLDLWAAYQLEEHFPALIDTLVGVDRGFAYSRIIEYFPSGGGGYIVATHTLGEKYGVISGAALLVDYMLTITVSIVSCGDALFSFAPLGWQPFKTAFEIAAIVFLVIINLRGVKESVTMLARSS